MEMGLAVGMATWDRAIAVWPIGPGTKAALRRICPDAKSVKMQRQLLRVLQRALGGGTRRVHIISISALLCFWDTGKWQT
jgi:hypothetical protein